MTKVKETGSPPSELEARPVSAPARIDSVDILRGAALLGILVINIISFALPGIAMKIPSVAGGMTGPDIAAWWVSYLFFFHKCMPVFSMLFGAGLVLMYRRMSRKGIEFRRFWYSRVLWLMAIGLVHAYLIWSGDILYGYGVTGLIIFLFKDVNPKRLILVSFAFLIVGAAAMSGMGHYFGIMRDKAAAVERKIEAEEEPTQREAMLLEGWQNIRKGLDPTEEQLAELYGTYRGGYLGILRHRAPELLMGQTFVMIFLVFWRIAGLMLLGMALMKYEVFSASRSKRFYVVLTLTGYAAGLAMVGAGVKLMFLHQFDFVKIFKTDAVFNYFGGMLVALGHIGLIMLFCRSGILGWLRSSLAAVGRMALTNYLIHSVICTTIFYGYGFGLFGRVMRAQLMAVVLAIWILQLVISPLWLGRFRFGPAEWLWRSLTYRKLQPMRLARR